MKYPCKHKECVEIRYKEFASLDLVDFLWNFKVLDFNSEDIEHTDGGSVFAKFNWFECEKCLALNNKRFAGSGS